jgi:CheY-like chemotaxis protein
MSGDRDKCLSVGCDEYATKPVNPKMLAELCASLIRQKQANKAAA